MTFETINAKTGFANGEQFNSEAEARSYFTEQNQREMFGPDALPGEVSHANQDTLDEMAEAVIANRWHCRF